MNYVQHTQCQKSSNKPAPVTVPSSPVSNLGTKLSKFLSEKATQAFFFFSQNFSIDEKYKNDLVLEQIAVWILFIYLFMLGNNARLILKVTDHREKQAAKGSRECMLIRAKTPLLLVSSVGDVVGIFALYSCSLLDITFLCNIPQFVLPESCKVQLAILKLYFSHHVLNLSFYIMSEP